MTEQAKIDTTMFASKMIDTGIEHSINGIKLTEQEWLAYRTQVETGKIRITPYTMGFACLKADTKSIHADGVPAIWTKNYKIWYKDGRAHNEVGPAEVHENGLSYYWLNGKTVRQSDWEKEVAKMSALTKHDFGDGKGLVPAHKHKNGGGWVADTAFVDAGAYVGPNAQVRDQVRVVGMAAITGFSVVKDEAVIRDNATISNSSLIYGKIAISHSAKVSGSEVGGIGYIDGDSSIKNSLLVNVSVLDAKLNGVWRSSLVRVNVKGGAYYNDDELINHLESTGQIPGPPAPKVREVISTPPIVKEVSLADRLSAIVKTAKLLEEQVAAKKEACMPAVPLETPKPTPKPTPKSSNASWGATAGLLGVGALLSGFLGRPKFVRPQPQKQVQQISEPATALHSK